MRLSGRNAIGYGRCRVLASARVWPAWHSINRVQRGSIFLRAQAAASDEKSRSEPTYLSDLIAFESDSDSESSTAAAPTELLGSSPGSSGTSKGSGSSGSGSSSSRDLAASLGLASSAEVDPTARAQEIINRATEVLAAARAALGTSSSERSTPTAPTTSGSSSSGSGSGSGSSSGPPAPPSTAAAAAAAAPVRQTGSSPSSSSPSSFSSSSSSSSLSSSDFSSSSGSITSGGAGIASSSTSSGGGGASFLPGSSSSSSGGSSGSSEPLTRRWSPLSEDQDLTRHVLQSALDQMQKSSAPIAAPKDPPTTSGGSSSSSGSGSRPMGSSGGGGGVGGGGVGGSGSGGFPSAAASAAAAGGGGVTRGSSSNRDIRFGSSSSSSSSRGGGGGGGGAAVAVDPGHGPAPSWAQSLLGPDDFGASASGYSQGSLFPPEPQLQRAEQAPAPSAVMFAATLSLLSQSAMDAQKARNAVLPPLQSVVELTTAYKPPQRSGGIAAATATATAATATATAVGTAVEAGAEAAVQTAGRALADGTGRLPDGTWWEKKSGIEYGKNGYWKKWQLLRGGNAEGTLEWSECWWEASDWTGLKEMGAEKKGKNAEGDAWRESWSERLMYASNNLDCVVERNAHKWAAEANGDEWEEKWGEHYHASGKVAKHADKWGKQGPNVWHERWGEDYDSGGDACVKWTDKWAERLLPGGAREQWGDKWHEAFANGRGEKNGEVWSVGAGGDRYQRWWGEQHLGDMRVRRFGHSTGGEQWDETISMDTYYNPVPHFGFKLALQHSPQLKSVPLQPKAVNEKDPFGPGLDQL